MNSYGGYADYNTLIDTYGSLDNMPEIIKVEIEELVEQDSCEHIANEIYKDGLVSSIFTIDDFSHVLPSPFVYEYSGNCVSDYELSKLENSIYNIEPALTYNINNVAGELMQSVDAVVNKDIQQDKKWNRISEHTYINSNKKDILSTIQPFKSQKTSNIGEHAR